VTAPVIGAGRSARERSHTDPGHVSRIPSRSPHVQTIPRVPPPVSTFSTPGQEPQVVRLNRGYAAISNSSGSELSLQGDRGRALFVTNAVIVPSSSSSSEEVEACQLSPYVRVKHPAWSSHMLQRIQPFGARSAQSGVGLGLGTTGTTGNGYSNATPHIGSGMPDGDVESEYNSDPGDEDAGHLISSSSAHLRSLVLNRQTLSSPDLSRNNSASSGDALPNPWNSGPVKSSEGDQRRRELIELVNGMDHGSLNSAPACEYDDGLSDDEYVGEQGLAISPSDEFGNIMDTTLKPGHENGSFPWRRSPGAGQATPRQLPSAPISMAFSGDNSQYSSPRNLSRTIARDQMTETRRKDKGDDFSPLSEYSGDEDAHHDLNKATSPSAQRIPQTPPARDRPLFGGIREGDRSLSSRESSGRAPTVGVAFPPSTRLRSSGSRRPSGSTQSTTREMLATSSLTSSFDGAHSSGGTQSLGRVRERKGQRSPATILPHADSSSSIESLRWQHQHEDQDISVDAEAIFEQLRVGRGRLPGANETSSVHSQRQGQERKSQTNYPSKTSSPRDTPNSLPQTTTDTPKSHDVAGAYERTNTIQETRADARSSQSFEPEQRTWLSTISSSAYHSLLDRYGEVEIKRQQIIWDLCETERTFVRRLQTFVRLFIRPLRMKDSVTWLAGVPIEVARLFDWLEDIINLHAQISSALRAVVSEQYPIVMRIAGRVRTFVSRLEVHQPYVVRLESSTLLIKRLSGEPSSDFGEWIRIQQEQDECHGWSVEAFLVEPVNRLVDYPIHFKVRFTSRTSLNFSKLSYSDSWMSRLRTTQITLPLSHSFIAPKPSFA
jgi:RhoGEF domain